VVSGENVIFDVRGRNIYAKAIESRFLRLTKPFYGFFTEKRENGALLVFFDAFLTFLIV
jgi:hypothetical protein